MNTKANILPISYNEAIRSSRNEAFEEETLINVKLRPADVQCMQRMTCINLCWKITAELWSLILITIILIAITTSLFHSPLCTTLHKLVPLFHGNVVEFEQKVNWG